MANKYVEIKLDKMRNLRYGMRALNKIEETLGKPVAKLDFGNVTMKDLAVLVWAGLEHEDKELTPEKVFDLVDEYSDITTVAGIMGKAMTEGLGKNDQRVAENQ